MLQCQGGPVTDQVETSLKGSALLNAPLLNKGVAFTEQERQALHLKGILPAGIATLEDQLKWAYEAFRRKNNVIDQHLFLRELQDTNEVLFFRLLLEHIVEMTPIIYTPVIGAICQEYSQHFRRPRGLFISYEDRDRIDDILAAWPHDDVRVTVVTDGERVLGLGDQGIGGMGISIGKLALYSLCAGIHPAKTLPIVLDVGTDNKRLLQDPLYLGWRHPRIRGHEYDDFIDRFVQALYRRFPDILLQWEDFAKGNARKLMERYQNRVCSFNDDIQGTAAVTLAGLIAAVNVAGSRLVDQTIAIAGAGSAGTGIADLIVQAMVEDGATEQDAVDRIWIFNSKGLVSCAQTDLEPALKRYAKNADTLRKYGLSPTHPSSLEDVVANVHQTALIGVSGQPGHFSEKIVRTMATHVKRPIIFPLSNPTSYSEATPENLILWTEGRALIGTGSPFESVSYNGVEHVIAQCNNSLIFPGLGLAILSTGCQYVVDEMLIAAGRALAKLSPALHQEGARLLPSMESSRKIAVEVALAVAMAAQEAGVCAPIGIESVKEIIEAHMWFPDYPSIFPIEGASYQLL